MLEKSENSFVSEEDFYLNTLSLIGALFRLAAQDLKYGDKKEVLEFLESEWFEELCSNMNLESKEVKRLIMTSNILQRMEYN